MTGDAVMGFPLTDPGHVRVESPSLRQRVLARLIRDERDLPLVSLLSLLLALFPPCALYLLSQPRIDWFVAGPYLLLNLLVFVGPYTMMVHNICHRVVFRPRYQAFSRFVAFWILAPIFGQSPETYYCHHVGMHHPENNLVDDVSSTLRYQRDSLWDFSRYLARFTLLAFYDLAGYFWRRGKRRLWIRTVVGEAAYYLLVGAALLLNWRGALIVFVIPWVFVRLALMAGNWAQHAFIDLAAPANSYRNSITCINSRYNRVCFNDGYHAGHHLRTGLHWTEMPDNFLKNLHSYRSEGAVVFRGIDYLGVWLALMLKQYGWLAERYVDLSERPLSKAEIIALLRSRTRKRTVDPLVEASRPLGGWERMTAIMHQEFHGTGILVGCARLEGLVERESLCRAWAAMVALHPALRARIAWANGEPRIESLAANASALPVAFPQGADWQLLMEEEMSRPFDSARGPLWRVHCVNGAGTSDIVVALHHTIADGLSLTRLLDDLLTQLSPGELAPVGYGALQPAIESSHGSKPNLVLYGAGFLSRALMRLVKRQPRVTFSGYAPFPDRRTRHLFFELAANETDALVRVCRKRGTPRSKTRRSGSAGCPSRRGSGRPAARPAGLSRAPAPRRTRCSG